MATRLVSCLSARHLDDFFRMELLGWPGVPDYERAVPLVATHWCALDEDHVSNHAAYLYGVGPDKELWIFWGADDRYRLVEVAPCPVVSPGSDECDLYLRHPSEHSWAFR